MSYFQLKNVFVDLDEVIATKLSRFSDDVVIVLRGHEETIMANDVSAADWDAFISALGQNKPIE